MRWGPRKLKRILERGRRRGATGRLASTNRRPVEARRSGGGAQEAFAHRAVHATVGACAGMQPACGAPISRAGFAPGMESASIRSPSLMATAGIYCAARRWRKRHTERVQAIFEAAFREYGIPEAIRTDNGPPFAWHAVAGLSRLAGVVDQAGDSCQSASPAGHPEQNGRHERMHRTLKQEAAQPPAANRRQQQQELHRFRQEYNQVRPHEALGMQTPAAVYRPSARKLSVAGAGTGIPSDHVGAQRALAGYFSLEKHDVFLTEVLWGENVGLLPEDDRWFTIYFAQHPLARFDSQKLCVTPLPKTRSQATAVAGEGGSPPSPAVHPLPREDSNVSAIRRSKMSTIRPPAQFWRIVTTCL